MTKRPPRRPAPPPIEDPVGTTDTPRPDHVRAAPPDPGAARLEVLRHYADPTGLLHVTVAVAHDAVFVGQDLRVPVTDRVAGLLELGFLEIILPVRDWEDDLLDLPDPGSRP